MKKLLFLGLIALFTLVFFVPLLSHAVSDVPTPKELLAAALERGIYEFPLAKFTEPAAITLGAFTGEVSGSVWIQIPFTDGMFHKFPLEAMTEYSIVFDREQGDCLLENRLSLGMAILHLARRGQDCAPL